MTKDEASNNAATRPQFAIATLGAKFGAQLAQVFSELIIAEKIIEAQRVQIQAMTESEMALNDRIRQLKAENYGLQDAIREQQPLSMEAAEIATAANAIIATTEDGSDGKEKTARPEAV